MELALGFCSINIRAPTSVSTTRAAGMDLQDFSFPSTKHFKPFISMKKFLALLIATFLLTTCHSQVLIALLFGDKLNTGKLEFGLNAGLNISDITGMESGEARTGLNLALYFNIKISEKFSIHPEAIPKYSGGVKKMKPYPI